MKQIYKKKGVVKLSIDNLEDLWYLHRLIETGDFLKGKTERKINMGEKGKPVKKTIFLQILVEKTSFEGESLRVSGVVEQGPEEVASGSHHSFSLAPGSVFSLEKENWPSYQLEILKESLKGRVPPLLICVHDREEAYFALVKKQGFEILGNIKGNVEKKREGVQGGDFYKDVVKQLEEYDER